MKISPERLAAAHPLPEWRFLQLTLAIVAWMFIAPHLEARLTGHLALQLMLLDLMIVTLWANPRWVKARRVVLALWALSLLASIVVVAGLGSAILLHTEATLDVVFIIPVTAACVAGVLSFAFRMERLTVDGIFAMVVAYLLIGILFAEAQYMLIAWNPDALHLTVSPDHATSRELRSDLMYFSLVTLTTVGYGDILPVSSASRVLATLEAVTGQFYVAVVVATFVAKFTTQLLRSRDQ